MNEFDLQDIKNITKEKIAISNFQSRKSMKNNEKSKIIFWTRTLTSISACIIFSCGIIFSKEISTPIYNYAINKENEKTTINNGNTAKFSGEYSISNEEIIDLENIDYESLINSKSTTEIIAEAVEKENFEIENVVKTKSQINIAVIASCIFGILLIVSINLKVILKKK